MHFKDLLSDARSGLIDFSFANPLLNCKQSKKRGLQIEFNNPIRLFQKICSPDCPELDLRDGDDFAIALSGAELDARAKFTATEAKLFIEEKGVNVLFLTFGFINWIEDERAESCNRSPILLMPIRLINDGSSVLKISKLDEDVLENFALLEKLAGLGIQMPKWSPEIELDAYFSEINKLVNLPLIKNIDLKTSVIDIFRTQKYFMYEDLNPTNWIGEENEDNLRLPEFIDKLINNDLFDPPSKIMAPEEVDQLPLDSEPFLVKDADFSQFSAINSSRIGKSFVIQGPPGTGKSQTITNLIADLVSRNKSVLFVSEKSTALDVVKSNLVAVGLGKIVLDLHDSDTRKTSILRDISETTDCAFDYPESSFNSERYVYLKNHLSDLREILNTPAIPSGLLPEHIFTKLNDVYRYFEVNKISFTALDDQIKEYKFGEITHTEFTENLKLIKDLDLLLQDFQSEIKSIFSKISFAPNQVLDTIYVEGLISEAVVEVGQYVEPTGGWKNHDSKTKVALNKYVDEVGKSLIKYILNENVPSNDFIQLGDLEEVFKKLTQHRLIYKNQITDLAWSTPIIQIKHDLESSKPKLKHFFTKVKNQEFIAIKNLYFYGKISDAKYLELCRVIESHQAAITKAIELNCPKSLIRYVRELSKSSLNANDFLEIIKALRSDFSKLESLNFFDELKSKTTEQLLDYLDDAGPQTEVISRIHSVLLRLAVALGGNVEDFLSMSKEQLKLTLNNLPEAIKKRHDWERVAQLNLAISRFDGALFLSQVVCPPSYAYEYAYYKNLMSEIKAKIDISKLNGVYLEALRAEYKQLDDVKKNHSVLSVNSAHRGRIRELLNQPTEGFVSLNKIFKKSRNIPSIRKVIHGWFHEISTIKPVFMMSPLSVASFIPRKINAFDYVIFDEASQIKPSDALGAILRARSAIIVGDSMQLPPTRVFDSDSTDVDSSSYLYDALESGNFVSGLKDIGSILDSACSLRMPSFRLNWHYRSKFSDLIAVSNSEFYENSLITFPDSRSPKADEGVKFHFVENGNYERSTTRKNTNEAQAVVNEIFEHIKKNPDKSLGVATFSVAQKEAIEERLLHTQEQRALLDEFDRLHPNEKFFIKNLERVQGDERDCIFISIGYGKTTTSISDSINFGPLNQSGGDKRLNVLISRAKYLCKVFSSIHYYDIKTDNSTSSGVNKLKIFLKFAETGELDVPLITGGDYDSEFERSVANALRNLGYDVDCQVGSAGFKVDLAIRDKNRPGDYLCGIECDGATYHSSLTARERDRIRQEILESRGWKILRIWSTDWFRAKDKELDKIQIELKKMCEDTYVI